MLRGKSVPREVRLKSFWQAKAIWRDNLFLWGFFLFCFFMFTYDCMPLAATYWGKKAQVQVVEKHLAESYGTLLAYFGIASPVLGVEFSIGDQLQHADINDLSRRVFDKIQIGDKVDIHYLPPFPGRPSMDSDPPSVFKPLGFLLVLFFPCLLIWGFNAERRLLGIGLPREGLVTRIVYAKWWLLDFSSTAYVSFSWGGKAYAAATTLKNYGGKNQPGDTVIVLVNPQNPKDNIVYDDSAFSWRPISFDNYGQ